MRKVGVVAAALTALAAACSSTTSADLIRQEITEPVTAIIVNAHEGRSGAGSITIDSGGEPGTGTQVDVSADYSGDRPPNASADLQNGVLTITYDCGTLETCDVQLAITTEFSSADVTVFAAASEVSVRGSSGTVDLTTASGSITLDRVATAVEVDTASGGVDGISLGQGSFQVDTASGSVDMTWSREPTAVMVTTGSGSVTLRLPGGPYQVSANSGSGNVNSTVASDPNAAATVSVSSGSGSITIESR